jgi:mono/diheme cytochrome c family protein
LRSSPACRRHSPAQQPPVNRADLKPGLLLTVADKSDGPAVVTRTEPGVALTLAPGEAPHPRSAGGQTFTWKGLRQRPVARQVQVRRHRSRKLTLSVGGKEVLSGAPPAPTRPRTPPRSRGPEFDLAAGIRPIEATLTRTGPAVRVDLFWRGPQFRPEPVPHYVLGHLPAQRPESFAADVAKDHGRLLFEELSCAKCHQPDANDKAAKSLVDRTGPNLSEIGKRAYPGWLDAWLADPHKLRPHTVMPKMFADDATGRAERYAVVRYLSSLGGPAKEAPAPANWKDYLKLADDGRKVYLTTGCASCHGDKLTGPPTARKPRTTRTTTPGPRSSPKTRSTRRHGRPEGAVPTRGRRQQVPRPGADEVPERPARHQPAWPDAEHGAVRPGGVGPRQVPVPADRRRAVERHAEGTRGDAGRPRPARPSGADEGKGFDKLKPAEQWTKIGQAVFNTKAA